MGILKVNMISKRLCKALNEQIKWEMGAANLYLSMSAYFANLGFNGFSQWMRIQYDEEMIHAMKIYDYLLSSGDDVQLGSVPAPAHSWDSPLAAFEAAAKHEAGVTRQIHKMVAVAREDKDYGGEIFLQWFVTEQIEEEESVKNIIDRLRLLDNDGPGLLALDRDLGSRQAAVAE